MLKRTLASLFVAASILALVACGTSNQDTCDRVASLCNGSSTKAVDGGSVTVTTKTTCTPDELDKVSNKDEVKDCIDAANDCTAVTACMFKAKP